MYRLLLTMYESDLIHSADIAKRSFFTKMRTFVWQHTL